jgi:hypothetical protein
VLIFLRFKSTTTDFDEIFRTILGYFWPTVADLADLRFSLWAKIFIFCSKNFFLKNFQILLFGQKKLKSWTIVEILNLLKIHLLAYY